MEESFLQSSEWEKFQKAFGNRVFRIQGVLLIKNPKMRLPYLYAPRVGKINSLAIFKDELNVLAKKEKAVFVKIEPYKVALLTDFPNAKQSATVQPQTTLLVNLGSSEEKILDQMRSKTRYNIRLATRNGVEVIEQNTFESFWALAQKTSERNNFRYHSKRYFELMLKTLAPKIKIFSAIKEGKILASAIVLFWGEITYYLHGASLWEARQLMAPYKLHWEIMKIAKRAGCGQYDMWGIKLKPQISNLKSQNYYSQIDIHHSWAGITRFKLGFAPEGRIINYPDALDLIYRPFWYKIYSLKKKQ